MYSWLYWARAGAGDLERAPEEDVVEVEDRHQRRPGARAWQRGAQRIAQPPVGARARRAVEVAGQDEIGSVEHLAERHHLARLLAAVDWSDDAVLAGLGLGLGFGFGLPPTDI